METLNSITSDIIASGTGNVPLSNEVTLSDNIVARDGYLIAVRLLDHKPTYNQVELRDGTFVTIDKGQILIGTLGERQALRGYSGIVPRKINKGDVLHILNMGGIIGLCQSAYPSFGPAMQAEVLGAVMINDGDNLKHASISDHAIEWKDSLGESAPIIAVTGTCMNVGKTLAASLLVKELSQRGYRVAAGKLTGASLMRDTRSMKKNGAIDCINFTEAGLVSTTHQNVLPMAKGVIAQLNKSNPDVIVVEFGDGIIGPYGVDNLLIDKELQQHIAIHIAATQDLTGCWALDHLFKSQYNRSISLITGPVTDNIVGINYIQNTLGIKAVNAVQNPEKLTDCVIAELKQNVKQAIGA
jgi:hypothetical protein